MSLSKRDAAQHRHAAALPLSLSKRERSATSTNMPFYVYILQCADGTYYTGHTDDLDQRMAQHGAGEGCAYTAKRRPLKLLWATDCQTREQAFELEKQVQGWSRAKKQPLMRGDFAALPALSRSRTTRAHVEPVETRAQREALSPAARGKRS